MQSYILDMLQCPSCHGKLSWSITKQNSERIEEGNGFCNTCSSNYPIRDEIGIFLTNDLPINDMWEQTANNLTEYLKQYPEIENKLMNVPLETLSPADQFYRSLVLEEQRKFKNAKEAREQSFKGIYTKEYLECWNKQLDYVVESLSNSNEPIVDLASGQGYLVEEIIRRYQRPVIVTDFSLSILKHNRLRLKYFEIYDQVSLLAFDARRTPFKDDSIKTMTTNMGLVNIQEPANLLQELQRINSGTFYAISFFYPEEDKVNRDEASKLGIESLIIEKQLLALFDDIDWQVNLKNECIGIAKPTPKSLIFENAGIDTFPVKETLLKWATLIARR